MIYRKWSLLTGTVAITGGIFGAVIIANYLFVEPYIKPEEKKHNPPAPNSRFS